jgi:hypothetical protein
MIRTEAVTEIPLRFGSCHLQCAAWPPGSVAAASGHRTAPLRLECPCAVHACANSVPAEGGNDTPVGLSTLRSCSPPKPAP